MGLFDKKYCDICGEKIGLLGNRKLEDGNLCKDCAKKLSPWFNERRHSTLNDIREQLEYRETNKEEVAAFHTSRSIGAGFDMLMLDEAARKFAVCDGDGLKKDNPDIIKYEDVTNVRLDVVENKTERTYRNSQGENVSYNPPQYDYSYDFYCIINVNNRFFDELKFKLNKNEVEIRETGIGLRSVGRSSNAQYDFYVKMCDDISNILLNREAPEEVGPSESDTWVCPYCGGMSTGFTCQNCGAARQ